MIADRLATYSARLRTGSLTRAKALWSVWQSYNDAQNPLRDDRLPHHQGSATLNLMASAVLHETIMILVRAFDRPGQRGPFRTDKVSFPVVLALVEQVGVRAEVEQRARNWLPDGWQGDENARACLQAIDTIAAILARLDVEQPNRQRRLRDFRDEFLAHNLEFDDRRDAPIFHDITTLLDELTELSDAAELAFNGNNVHWDVLHGDMQLSAASLWAAIHEGARVNAAG
jgi:hypothetical protein